MEKPALADTSDRQRKPPISEFVIPPDKVIKAKHHFKDEYLVILKKGVKFTELASRGPAPSASIPDAIASFVKQFGAEPQAEVILEDEDESLGFGIHASPEAARRLAADGRVEYVREAGEVHAFTSEPNAPWGLDRSDQKSVALDHSYEFASQGSQVEALVVDSGIKVAHCDFRVDPCVTPGPSRVERVFPASYAATSPTNSPETNAHGTHVAGTLGGTQYGMAKSVKLLALKIDYGSVDFPNGVLSSTNTLAAALDWIIRYRKTHPTKPGVVNISVGAWYEDATIVTAKAAKLVRLGLVVVVAAGNHEEGDDPEACHVSPACAPGVIGVAATTAADVRRSTSNIGPCVDLFAPGENILSATLGVGDNTATEILSGTSMATPHVAGAAARYLQRHPQANPNEVRQYLISRALENSPVQDAGTGSPKLLLYVDPLL